MGQTSECHDTALKVYPAVHPGSMVGLRDCIIVVPGKARCSSLRWNIKLS